MVEFLHDVIKVKEFPWGCVSSQGCAAHGKYVVLMTGPSGSADIGGKTVHPAQGVMTLTVIIWPADRA